MPEVATPFGARSGCASDNMHQPVMKQNSTSGRDAAGRCARRFCICELRQLGFRVITPPEPGEAFENHFIAFVYARGLNVEIIDTDRKAGKLTGE